MPSAFAHLAVGTALATALPRSHQRIVIAITLAALAAAPDLDVVGFRLGIPYAHPLGHRGLTHSIPFAAFVGLLSLPIWRRYAPADANLAAALTFLAVASHGLLDAFTDAGLGVGFAIPFENGRYFSPFRPLATSPLSVGAFFSWHGLAILANETLWIGPIVCVIVIAGRAVRRRVVARRT